MVRLAYVTEVWAEGGMLKGTLRIDNTLARRTAFEQLPNGVSIGTTSDTKDVVVVDTTGRERDFDEREWRLYHQDPSAILHVKRWRLLEVSITDRPADRGAIARPFNREVRRIRLRMEAAQRRALDREDDDDGLLLRAIMPRSGTILCGAPEPLQLRMPDRALIHYREANPIKSCPLATVARVDRRFLRAMSVRSTQIRGLL
jgi:hypothetical protein